MFNTLNNINAVIVILSLIQLCMLIGFISTYGIVVGLAYTIVGTLVMDLAVIGTAFIYARSTNG